MTASRHRRLARTGGHPPRRAPVRTWLDFGSCRGHWSSQARCRIREYSRGRLDLRARSPEPLRVRRGLRPDARRGEIGDGRARVSIVILSWSTSERPIALPWRSCGWWRQRTSNNAICG